MPPKSQSPCMGVPDVVVIYHRADFDGKFCCAIAKKYFQNSPKLNVQYIGWDWGDPIPEVSSLSRLYMLDLTIDELMSHPNLVWIDHHITGIEKYAFASNAIQGLRIDGVAACRLAWQYFHQGFSGKGLTKLDYVTRNIIEPYAVQLVGEYDVWDKRNLDADNFQYGIKTISPDPFNENDYRLWYLDLLKFGKDSLKTCNQIIVTGKTVARYIQNENALICKDNSFDMNFEGYNFLALNHPKSNSAIFESTINEAHDGCLLFWWTGKIWRVTLYGVAHKPEIDMRKIAEAYGGGGHASACGFTVTDITTVVPGMFQLQGQP